MSKFINHTKVVGRFAFIYAIQIFELKCIRQDKQRVFIQDKTKTLYKTQDVERPAKVIYLNFFYIV